MHLFSSALVLGIGQTQLNERSYCKNQQPSALISEKEKLDLVLLKVGLAFFAAFKNNFRFCSCFTLDSRFLFRLKQVLCKAFSRT